MGGSSSAAVPSPSLCCLPFAMDQYYLQLQQQQQQQQQQQYVAAPQQYYEVQQSTSQQQMEEIALPNDAYPGQSYSFQAPDGRTVTFQVPQGMGPGHPLRVTY